MHNPTMDKETSEIDWSQFPVPLPSALFDKYTHQSYLPPLQSLGIDVSTWNECRSFALKLGEKGFIDPISILYTSFKRLYGNCPSIRSFSRWLVLHDTDENGFKKYFKQYSSYSGNFQSTGELISLIKTLRVNKPVFQSFENFRQIWFLFSISIRIPSNDYTLIADALIIDDGVTHLSSRHKRQSSRIHCLFALTPSGKFSNQLIVCKQSKSLKMNFNSSPFTRIVQTATGDVTYEHILQWFEDFTSLTHEKTDSAILIDPRLTLLTPDCGSLCRKYQIELVTIDLNYYLIHILSPIFSLFDKQIAEVNRLDKMFLKSAWDFKRIVYTLWCSLRTLKQNEQIGQIFHQTFLWRSDDELYQQAIRAVQPIIIPKRKKKKTLVKSGSKTKLSSSSMMPDPPTDSTPEQILSYVIQRQLSISRASKFLGGMKLDYFKYCLSYKGNSSLMTGAHLVQLNTFMQSQSTVTWLRRLRSLYFWPCAKQLFLREIYQLTGIITRKRSMNMCGNGTMGSIRSCDLQSPSIFWRAFEDIQQVQFDNESISDDEQWHDDFQQYICDHRLNHEKTQVWTIDTFEFPLTKKSTVLQLPEWNEQRPMNLTPKVTVIYAFSNTGQSVEPCFIFPSSLHDTTTINERDTYNELGHLTPQIFLSWIENNLRSRANDHSPIVLICCSRLPVLSPEVSSALSNYHIHPYGYPYARTLPFRYLFERRVRNNRSTNLMSELWKKKLLDQQRTHVLKGTNCTVKNIRYYFGQIWSQIVQGKGDEEEEEEAIDGSFENKCQQAFDQAHIQIKITPKKRTIIKLTPKRTSKKITKTDDQQIIQRLNDVIRIVSQYKENITAENVSQILKMNNYREESPDSQLSTSTMNSTETSSTSEKRSMDENDQPQLSKRLRSSCSQASNSTTVIKWIPPSTQLVSHLQSQSTSLFQFVLLLLITIFPSADSQLTDEHSSWLHSTLNSYDDQNYNLEKIDAVIEIACIVAKLNLAR